MLPGGLHAHQAIFPGNLVGALVLLVMAAAIGVPLTVLPYLVSAWIARAIWLDGPWMPLQQPG